MRCETAQEAFRDEGVREKDGAPDIAEFVVGAVQIENGGELPDEIVGRELARFKLLNESGGTNQVGDFVCGNPGEFGNARVAAIEIEGNDDTSEVENNGFDQSIL